MQRIFFFALAFCISCYAMDTQEEPSSKRHKSSATDDIITALFEQFDEHPLDESSISQLITRLKSQTYIDPSCFTKQVDGGTLLIRAVYRGSCHLVAELLSLPACKATIDVGNIDLDRFTPLAIAIENRNNQLVKLLLDHGARLDQGFKNKNRKSVTMRPAQYARSIGNLEALRLLSQKEEDLIFDPPKHPQLSQRQSAKDVLSKGDAKDILLEGIPAQRIPAFFDNNKLDLYIDQPFESNAQALENLMLAFAQTKITILKNLLARPGYKNILLHNDDDGRSLFSLANHLAFDTTRVRTELEKNEHLPIWQDQALLIGKPVVKWVLMTFKKLANTHQKSLPKDMIFLVLSFVIGESLLPHMKK